LLTKLARRLAGENGLNFAADIALTAFLEGIRSTPDQAAANEIIRETGISLTASASTAIKQLCSADPRYFASDAVMPTLFGKT